MRFLTSAVATLCLLGACADPPTQPDTTPPPDFKADVVTVFHTWFPLTPPVGGVDNACTGEKVLISGDYHLIVRSVTSTSGQTIFRVHVNVNLQGVGATTGTQYIANEITNLTDKAGPNGAATLSLVSTIHTLSKGVAANSSGFFRIQFTVNADGTVTVDREEFGFDICHG